MRIAILTTKLSGGGAEFVARVWAEWLAAHGHDTRIITTSPTDETRLPGGARVRPLGATGHAGLVRALRHELLREPADALVAVQSYPNLLALAATVRLANRPAVLISERNITSREGEPPTRGERLKLLAAQRFYRRADVVVAISHPVAAELIGAYGVLRSRLVIVPNPAGQRSEVRARHRQQPSPFDPEAPLNLVLPMRLVPQKRAPLAVAAAAVLRAQGVDARLVCFGQGPGLDELEHAARAAEVPLSIPGWTSDWVADTPANAIAVLPSYREGFGNVLVEAALGGIPSVAVSNSYGVADALVPTISGELALAGTPEDLAAAILRARSASIGRVDEWARRFSSDNSGALLLRAIEKATRRTSRTGPRPRPTVMVSAVGQFDNVGDTVLRRGFLDHLRTLGPLRVYVGDKSDDYISGLGLQQGDIAVRNGAQWRRAVSRQLLAGRGIYAFDTGETEAQAPFARRYLKLAPLLAINRLRGGFAVQLGTGVRESTPWRRPIAAVLRVCTMVTWRDDMSRRIMGIGSVTPDWAFALGSDDELLMDDARPRPFLAIAVRQGLSHAARDKPTAEWIATVRRLADSLGLEPVVLAQIERDGPLADELAERLGCTAITWVDDNHAHQEERLRAVYRDSAIILTDRLHAAVIGATEGAMPVALTTGPLDKVTRTLEGANIVGTSVPRALPSYDEALSVMTDALSRRSEIMRAVGHARTVLNDLTAALRTRTHG